MVRDISFSLSLALILSAPLVAAYLAIAPLHALTRPRRGKATLLTIDLFALLILVQVALAIGLTAPGRAIHRDWTPMLILLSVLIVVLWWAGVDALSQLGVRQASRRLLMHLLFLPGVCAIMVSTFLTAVMGIALTKPHHDWTQTLEYTLLLFIGTIVGVWLLRVMSLWIARGGGYTSST